MKPPRILFSFADITPLPPDPSWATDYPKLVSFGPIPPPEPNVPAGTGDPYADHINVTPDFEILDLAHITDASGEYLLNYPRNNYDNESYPYILTGNRVRLVNCQGLTVAFSCVDGAVDQPFTNADPASPDGWTASPGGLLCSDFCEHVGGNFDSGDNINRARECMLNVLSNDVTIGAEFRFRAGERPRRIALHLFNPGQYVIDNPDWAAPPPGGGGGGGES